MAKEHGSKGSIKVLHVEKHAETAQAGVRRRLKEVCKPEELGRIVWEYRVTPREGVGALQELHEGLKAIIVIVNIGYPPDLFETSRLILGAQALVASGAPIKKVFIFSSDEKSADWLMNEHDKAGCFIEFFLREQAPSLAKRMLEIIRDSGS